MGCRNTISQIELTNQCFSKCWYCRNKDMKREHGYMNLDLVEQICNLVQDRQDFMLLHYYGESLLHENFCEACEILDRHNICPGVFTCGKLSDNLIEQIASSSLRYISITMNRHDPREQVKKLRASCNEEVYIQVAYINLPKNEQKYSALTSKELSEWTKRISLELDKEIKSVGLSYEYPEKVNGKLACSFKTKKGECKIRLENSYCVLWDGSLVTCIKDYEGETSLGNVLKNLDKVRYEDCQCPY